MTQTAVLSSSDAAPFVNFGTSVSISRDVVVAGAPYATVGILEGQGAAYVFVKPKSGWRNTVHFQSKLSNGGSFAGFGISVSNVGGTVVAGAWNVDYLGAAYLFSTSPSF